ncbi:MbtH family NRPS accessory protein [Streptomyces sp. DSM 41527]|uniref:MbtH family NRPS accessory protein n=1 Tax=Streptomyces mooreae TaxID=3075523 RepID=A0ABU2T6I8_9ACTN|nr:MbtH family NRPS accessory protein [Streptomyces sp. DSM 41527]MDT0456831.1 MbtH family NRPS accessory protein [Streptomyces sp. DSM 41527]
MDDHSRDRTYRVVRNDEEQYSIWWADRPLPDGWYADGTEGSREDCLSYIDTVWTDMRPLSLRRRMERSAAG